MRGSGGSSGWKALPGGRKLREQVFAAYGRACWRCGGYANSVDHVVAVVLGGSHDLSNLRPCCSGCNSSMGASLGNRLGGPRGYRRRGRRPAAKAARAPAGTTPSPLRTSRNW
jgi:5-methylcytosine-specific restriction endonuclease McrA